MIVPLESTQKPVSHIPYSFSPLLNSCFRQKSKIWTRPGLVGSNRSWKGRIISALKDFRKLIFTSQLSPIFSKIQPFLSNIDPMPNNFGLEKLRKNNATGIALARILYFQKKKIVKKSVIEWFQNSILMTIVPQRA